MDNIHPNFVEIIAWLTENNFEVTDYHAQDEEFSCNDIAIFVEPENLVIEARRLCRLLTKYGVEISPIGDNDNITIQASFDPYDESAIIILYGLDDTNFKA